MKISSIKKLSQKEKKHINGSKCDCICRNFGEDYKAPVGKLKDEGTCWKRCFKLGKIFESCKE